MNMYTLNAVNTEGIADVVGRFVPAWQSVWQK